MTVTVTTHANIVAALAAAQAQMGKALKQSNNPHFKSKYADLAAVMDAALPALNANGIAVIQPPGEDETGRYVDTILMHGDERLCCRVPLIVAKNDMQGYGSAVTYGRRYGMLSMCSLAPDDDDGNAAVAAAPRSVAPRPTAEPARRRAPSMVAQGMTEADAIDAIAKARTVDDLETAWRGFPAALQNSVQIREIAKGRKTKILAHAPSPAADLATQLATQLDDTIPEQE